MRLLCCTARQEMSQERKFEEDIDRVEAAFIKFDTDGDGFIDWEEFKQVTFVGRLQMF